MLIRRATLDDIADCQRITRLPGVREYLPFVMRSQLADAVARRSLLVAEADGAIAGFVHYRTRRDGWSVVYDLAVNPEAQGQGIGRALLYAVPAPVRLKCTADNPANRFYTRAGMMLAGTETARSGRQLNVYERRVLTILCQGNNKKMPDIARAAGCAYGTRSRETARDWPFMLDIEFKNKNYDWREYMALVQKYHPVMVMVADYESPSQRRQLYQQIRDLRDAGVLRVMVCPKFPGAVAHIPSWCVVAISIPSRYAGFVPPLEELRGRKMHLLGGSPPAQRDWLLRLNAVGHVLSLDNNSVTGGAEKGVLWDGTFWRRNKHHLSDGDYYAISQTSLDNLRRMSETTACYVQPPLF